VVAAALGRGEEVYRVSVLARGTALGATAAGGDDKVVHTAAELGDRLTMALAGTAAEEALLGGSSTTAAEDVARATALAREMVGLYGMSPAVGRVRVLARSGSYLDDGSAAFDAVGPRTLEAFDAEVRRLLTAAEAQARAIVEANRPALDALVARLNAEETLEGDELTALLATVVPAPHPGSNGSSPKRVRATVRAGTAG
jgi:cell division protease FtsH